MASQNLSQGYGEEKNVFPFPGIEPQFLCHPFRSLVSIQTKLSWLFQIRF
jgi:hypothetical protein